MIVRQIVKNSTSLHLLRSYAFSTPFFNKAESITEPISKSDFRFSPTQDKQTRENKRENLSALVEKINDANKYFLGVKLNTNYLKVNKVVNYADVAALTT